MPQLKVQLRSLGCAGALLFMQAPGFSGLDYMRAIRSFVSIVAFELLAGGHRIREQQSTLLAPRQEERSTSLDIAVNGQKIECSDALRRAARAFRRFVRKSMPYPWDPEGHDVRTRDPCCQST